MTKRPKAGEYAPHYSSYIKLVENEDILQILNVQMDDTVRLLENLSGKEGEYRYAPGKWSIKEVIGHLTDTERIMTFRLLSFARGESAELPGYEDEEYVKKAGFNSLSIQEILEDFGAVRKSTIQLVKRLDEEAWSRGGNANGSYVTVLALAWIIAGHELHHRKIIEERYLQTDK
ncbi:DinB family protein [Falsibacillus albus]|uniref:DinB family protein n=1 Tax=Falsibacillus albus TaxID=2478915 RepID=A0A3L7JRE6_9BACI|nr:DinB family protein [Falsibacillus albus]RLQ93236.1 DinB family protein [Falsibacillus albus]